MYHTASHHDIIPLLVKMKYPYYEPLPWYCCTTDERYKDHEAYYITWNKDSHHKQPYFIEHGDIVSIIIFRQSELVGWYTHPEARKRGLGKTLLLYVLKRKPIYRVDISFDMYPYMESMYAIRVLTRYGFVMMENNSEHCILRKFS
jgi:hypothetical protein